MAQKHLFRQSVVQTDAGITLLLQPASLSQAAPGSKALAL